MVIHRPLDYIFAARSHVAVLRVLLNTAQGLTGREIARQARMNHQACLQSLTRLEKLGLVRRQRGGSTHLFAMNREHELLAKGILPLLRVERDFGRQITRMLKRDFEDVVLAGGIFGSVARREESPESDLDVCLIVASAADREVAHARVSESAPTLWRRFGVRIAPVVLTRAELKRRFAKKDPLVESMFAEAVWFVEGNLKDLMDGTKK